MEEELKGKVKTILEKYLSTKYFAARILDVNGDFQKLDFHNEKILVTGVGVDEDIYPYESFHIVKDISEISNKHFDFILNLKHTDSKTIKTLINMLTTFGQLIISSEVPLIPEIEKVDILSQDEDLIVLERKEEKGNHDMGKVE